MQIGHKLFRYIKCQILNKILLIKKIFTTYTMFKYLTYKNAKYTHIINQK